MTRRETPDLPDVFDSAVGRILSGVNTSCPGVIVAYDDSTLRAAVQPSIKRRFQNEEGEYVVQKLPVINEVPVIFPGSGERRVKFPVKKNDTVLLIFSQSSLDKWLETGGIVDPEDGRRHSLEDAVAIPGLMNKAKDAAALIEFDNAFVHVGGSAGSEPVIKATTFLNALSIWLEALDVYIKIPVPTPTETGVYEAASTAFSLAIGLSPTTIAKVR